MNRIYINQVEVGMKILEEDSYGNNVYVVTRGAYKHPNYPFLVADFRDVETNEIVQLGGIDVYEPVLYRLG